MIDTDKYEGHTEKVWADFLRRPHGNNANRKLLADAQLFLAEVERLRERLEVIEDFINDELRAFVNSNTFDHIYDAIAKKLEAIE